MPRQEKKMLPSKEIVLILLCPPQNILAFLRQFIT